MAWLRRVLGWTLPPARVRSIDLSYAIFREGDRVLVHSKNPQLTKPLRQGDKTHLRRGHLDHDRVIGSRVWSAVQAHKGMLVVVRDAIN
jgi:tRNA A58 N-methylase Trm61